LKIIQAVTKEQIKIAKNLFLEYAGSLDFELCFQDFDTELAELPGEYEAPDGRLFIAELDNKPAGCIALRKIDTNICEMKRLYVKPEYRELGIGKKLAYKLVEEARKIGYKKMRLDTVPSMKTAQNLYYSMGFREIKPYRANPVPGALYMELTLQ
jgi:ribosomal protein S18 acetylase RimI-like enzyme